MTDPIVDDKQPFLDDGEMIMAQLGGSASLKDHKDLRDHEAKYARVAAINGFESSAA